jgi:hypothetical protein
MTIKWGKKIHWHEKKEIKLREAKRRDIEEREREVSEVRGWEPVKIHLFD